MRRAAVVIAIVLLVAPWALVFGIEFGVGVLLQLGMTGTLARYLGATFIWLSPLGCFAAAFLSLARPGRSKLKQSLLAASVAIATTAAQIALLGVYFVRRLP
jgi:hypothetical protein